MGNRLQDAGTGDGVFEAFAHRKRRVLLCLLHGSGGGDTPVEPLAATVAARTGDRRRAVALSLRHAHLPKLDDLGFLEYDPDRDVVRYERSAAVGTVLETGLVDCPDTGTP